MVLNGNIIKKKDGDYIVTTNYICKACGTKEYPCILTVQRSCHNENEATDVSSGLSKSPRECPMHTKTPEWKIISDKKFRDAQRRLNQLGKPEPVIKVSDRFADIDLTSVNDD